MNRLRLPKTPYRGMKVYCNKCKLDNPKCKHHTNHRYRVRVHVPNTKNGVKVKTLQSLDYDGAVKEAIDFIEELKENNYQKVTIQDLECKLDENNYLLIDAVIHYREYINGESNYAHLKKDLTTDYINGEIRSIRLFFQSLKDTSNVQTILVSKINNFHVSRFYKYLESKNYSGKTFNSHWDSLRRFYDFINEIQKVKCDNPFKHFTRKKIVKETNLSLTKEEFNSILDAVNKTSAYVTLGGKHKERKNMYRTYLIDGFKLFLLCGARREEVVDLKWSDIFISTKGIMFFKIQNLKVSRNKKRETEKYIPINKDLHALLYELGYENKKHTDEFVLYPERTESSHTIMNNLSKAFTHYRKNAGIEKNISLKNLRKTYITWLNQVLGKDTGIVSGHSTKEVINTYYIDPQILSKIEESALELKIFG